MIDLRLAALRVPGDGESWAALGFGPTDGVIATVNGAIRVGGDEIGLEIDDVDFAATAIEGVPVSAGLPIGAAERAEAAIELDHVVIMTDSLDRTSAAVDSVLGLRQRRIRETDTVRQAFHRFGDVDGARGCIVEIVQNDRVDHPAIWGVVLIVDDLDRSVADSGGLIGAPRAAVQPGRRIATVGRSAGLPLAVAVMSR